MTVVSLRHLPNEEGASVFFQAGAFVWLSLKQVARELREAVTLPRSALFKWRTGTPYAPLHSTSLPAPTVLSGLRGCGALKRTQHGRPFIFEINKLVARVAFLAVWSVVWNNWKCA